MGKQFIDTHSQKRRTEPMRKLRADMFSTKQFQNIHNNIGRRTERACENQSKFGEVQIVFRSAIQTSDSIFILRNIKRKIEE